MLGLSSDRRILLSTVASGYERSEGRAWPLRFKREELRAAPDAAGEVLVEARHGRSYALAAGGKALVVNDQGVYQRLR